MSVCTTASRAAPSAVTAPTQAIVSLATPEACSTGKKRASRYTPAATIVAEWISAETGVGPSMASGNQK